MAEKSHSDCSKISSTLTKFLSTLAFKFISPEWLRIFGWNMYGVVLCGIKMKKKKWSRIMSQWLFKNLRWPQQKFCRPWHFSPFSETTAPVFLKFHMQHDESAGLQNDEIQPCQVVKNQKWPLLLKIIAHPKWLPLLYKCRDYAGPKFSGKVMSPSRRFRATFLAHLSTKCSWWAIVISQCPSSVVRCVSCVVNNLF